MKRILFILVFIPFFCSAQVYDHKRVFTDSIKHKDFNQGALDAKVYFRSTGDYFIGLGSAPAYFIPAAICYATPPKDRRFINHLNPNNEYLFSNADYYNGYKYGAKKKKRKRLVQGAITPIGVIIGVVGTLLLLENN